MKMTTALFPAVTLAATSLFATAPADAAEYAIDATHASIVFHVDHLGISETWGRFNEFEGDVTWTGSPADAAFSVTIQTASVDTAVPKRDDHLRSPDFFNVRQHPTITFESTGVEDKGEGLYHVAGGFTMNGRTRDITIPMTFNGEATMQGTEKVGFSGEITIDRREWGLDAWQGGVGNDIHIKVSFEANKK